MENLINQLFKNAIAEDIGDGDHTSRACIPIGTQGKAKLLVKQTGILAGVEIAQQVFRRIDPLLNMSVFIEDGAAVNPSDIPFTVEGSVHSILQAERLVLNIMQRMSGIATQTAEYVNVLKDYKTKILDTRKTTPGMRLLDKMAVRLGGGINHRIGLYDMIMVKDNHIDYAGGIEKAINAVQNYLTTNNKELFIVIEARSLADIETILRVGHVNRIMLDNFTIAETSAAVKIIDRRYETESSGGITINNLAAYAACGVNYISVGALTHQIKSLDLSLKAV